MTLFTKEDFLVSNGGHRYECHYTECLVGTNTMYGPCDPDTCDDPGEHDGYEINNNRYLGNMDHLYDRVIAIKMPKP